MSIHSDCNANIRRHSISLKQNHINCDFPRDCVETKCSRSRDDLPFLNKGNQNAVVPITRTRNSNVGFRM